MTILGIVDVFVTVYIVLIFVRVVMSWMQTRGPFTEFVSSLTDPVLDTVRRFLPSAGGLDFSPMVVILALLFISQLLQQLT